MKNLFIIIGLFFSWLSVNAQSYYYYKDQKIYMQENPLVRYVELKQTASPFKVKELHDLLNKCCWRTDEYSPYFNKYYINQDKYDEFLYVCSTHDSIISLHVPNYASTDSSVLYPTRMLLVKTQTDVNLQTVLTDNNIPYSDIIRSVYNNSEYTVYLTNDKALHYAAQLFETGYFDYAEPNFVGNAVLSGYEDNPKYPNQWAVHNQNTNINLLPAWAITTGHPKIKVAVIDSGVDLNHSDLTGNLLEGYDAVNDSTPVCCGEYENVFDWHGTCCAGIIGAVNNEIGIVGVAHTTKIIPIRYGHTIQSYHREPPDGSATWHWDWITNTSWIKDAFNHACYDDGADIISCSFSISTPSSAIDNKITEICENGRNEKGCVVVVAAGNTYNEISLPIWDTLGFLAKHPKVISVGSVNPCGERVIFGTHCNLNSIYNSCYGDSLDVVAPGINIPTTFINDSYQDAFAGTSSATPHVAGIAALVLSVNPCLTWEEVKHIIESTCTKVNPEVYIYNNNSDHPNGTWNNEMGYGLVNAYEAVQLAQQMGGYTYIKDTIISGNIIWTGNKMIHDSLVIDSLSTLTINDTIYMLSDARLIVRPGGKLVVDGGTLTSACDGEMWQGIEVVGDRTKRQLAQYQGTVELRNGATIENAWCGIRTGLSTDSNFNTTGGIIIADSAIFQNNRQSVVINPYAYTLPGSGVLRYAASFNRCSFTVNCNNLFAANNTAFAEHVRLWDVKDVPFKGCSFSNFTVNSFHNGRGIYAEDAGLELDTYCSVNYLTDCKCPSAYADSCSFSGFSTAVEVNTTGNPYSVKVNQVRFSNNGTGIMIDGNQFTTITRCLFNTDQCPVSERSITGVLLNTCTGYKVEENTFSRNPSVQSMTRTGIYVVKSGKTYNTLYRNVFERMTNGIYVSDTNGNSRTGLEFSCNEFTKCTYGLYAESGSLMAPSQGSISKGVDNRFSGTLTSSLYNNGANMLSYYHSSGSNLFLYNPTGVSVESNLATSNSCVSTLCKNGGGVIESLSEFESDMTGAQDLSSSQNSADDNEDICQFLTGTYYESVRALMSDTTLDLAALEQWHTAAQPIADPYSLTETRFVEGYADPFVADADDAEMANYAEFHAMKLALRDNGAGNDGTMETQNFASLQPGGHVNWYALTPAQIAQLQTIAERNTGRASVMAKGVLCFFFGICYEDGGNATSETDPSAETRAKHTAADIADETALTVYPNPTDDLLFVELRGAGIANVALYDLQGRVVETGRATSLQDGTATLNVKSLPAGVYVLRVKDAEGREYQQKVVRR